MIVMTPGATEAQVRAVEERLATTGVHVVVLPGEMTVAIGAIGDPEVVAELGLEGMAGVDRVVPISRPYKLASSELYHHEASVVEVAVNGYEVGPAGCQASLAGTVAALEILYGVDTGIDLAQLMGLSEMASKLMGIEIPWNEPVVGWGIYEGSGADEYEMEADFDRLIHASVEPAVLGGRRIRRIGVTTGPLGMWQTLRDLGIEADKDDVEPILQACLEETRTQGRALGDAEIRVVAEAVLAGRAHQDA